MIDTLWFNLQPTEWRSSVRADLKRKHEGRNLQVVCSVMQGADIHLLNTRERLTGLTVHLGIMAGEPTQGDGKPLVGSIGMLAFHEAQPANDEFGPSEAMLMGWCFVGHEEHADIWHQVSLNNHASCDITVTVGPIISNATPDWSWDVKQNLRIEDIGVAFARRKVETKEEKPTKRGIFG
jgi:hypothetical protein